MKRIVSMPDGGSYQKKDLLLKKRGGADDRSYIIPKTYKYYGVGVWSGREGTLQEP